MKLDLTDIRILELLKENSKISMREISKLIHLSPLSVAERIKRLEEEGIIEGYTVKINHQGASHILFGTDYPLRYENGVTESIEQLSYSGFDKD